MEHEILILKTFAELAKPLPEIPTEIKAYLDAPKNTKGNFFRFEKDGKSENTGDGMSYYDRTLIFYRGVEAPIYDSGFRLYRPGYAFSTDRDDLRTFDYRIIEEDEAGVTYGHRDGEGKIFVKKINKQGFASSITIFDDRAYNKALENQTVPQDAKAFSSWAYRQLPNIGGSGWENDVFHDDEVRTVVITRHFSRSVDATHDAYVVFVWVKGQGVGISNLYYTYGRDSNTKYRTNYLRPRVEIDENGDILLNARSEFGDVKIEKKFSFKDSDLPA